MLIGREKVKPMESPFKPEILKDKVALITGGGSGIGFELSTQFGKHGASIAIMGRRKQVLDSAVHKLRLVGIPVIYIGSNLFFYLMSLVLDVEVLGFVWNG